MRSEKVVYYADGEPYSRDGAVTNSRGEPVSVWGAVLALYEDEAAWEKMSKDLFGLAREDARLLMAEAVVDKVKETNSRPEFCGSSGREYFEIFIDPRGNHRLQIGRDV